MNNIELRKNLLKTIEELIPEFTDKVRIVKDDGENTIINVFSIADLKSIISYKQNMYKLVNFKENNEVGLIKILLYCKSIMPSFTYKYTLDEFKNKYIDLKIPDDFLEFAFNFCNLIEPILNLNIRRRTGKCFVMSIIPKLLDNWDTEFVMGSGQTKSTTILTNIFISETGKVPIPRKVFPEIKILESHSIQLSHSEEIENSKIIIDEINSIIKTNGAMNSVNLIKLERNLIGIIINEINKIETLFKKYKNPNKLQNISPNTDNLEINKSDNSTIVTLEKQNKKMEKSIEKYIIKISKLEEHNKLLEEKNNLLKSNIKSNKINDLSNKRKRVSNDEKNQENHSKKIKQNKKTNLIEDIIETSENFSFLNDQDNSSNIYARLFEEFDNNLS